MKAGEFEKEYRCLHLPLCMYVLRIVGDVDASQDIVQNVFEEVWRRISGGENIGNLKSYLYRAAHNSALSWLKERSKLDFISADLSASDENLSSGDEAISGSSIYRGSVVMDGSGRGIADIGNGSDLALDGSGRGLVLDMVSEEDVDTSERDAMLWRRIDALPDRCREVFLMSKRDGLTHKEISEELGISIKTVENQITKAFKSLRLAPNSSHSTQSSNPSSLPLYLTPIFFLPYL